MPGLVALYLLDTEHGDTAFDSSPNGYHLQLGAASGDDPRDPKWITVNDLTPRTGAGRPSHVAGTPPTTSINTKNPYGPGDREGGHCSSVALPDDTIISAYQSQGGGEDASMTSRAVIWRVPDELRRGQ